MLARKISFDHLWLMVYDQIFDMNLLDLNPLVLGQEIVFQARHKTFSVATQTNIN